MTDETALIRGIEYPTPFDELTVQLAANAVRHTYIMSPRLDFRVFDNQDLVAALAALVKRSRRTQVRILIADPRPLVSRGHRLLGLARRLPSSIQMRTLAEHPQWAGETVVLRDRDGVLFKPADADHEAFYHAASPGLVRQYLEQFTELWNCSSDNIELRSLRV